MASTVARSRPPLIPKVAACSAIIAHRRNSPRAFRELSSRMRVLSVAARIGCIVRTVCRSSSPSKGKNLTSNQIRERRSGYLAIGGRLVSHEQHCESPLADFVQVPEFLDSGGTEVLGLINDEQATPLSQPESEIFLHLGLRAAAQNAVDVADELPQDLQRRWAVGDLQPDDGAVNRVGDSDRRCGLAGSRGAVEDPYAVGP